MTFNEKLKVIFQIIIIVLFLTQSMLTEKSRCNSSMCNCSDYTEEEYQYQNLIYCPQNESIVRFEIMNYTGQDYIDRLGHPFIKTFIRCETNNQLVYDVISQTDVEYFDSVQYINCPVPLNSSLGDGMKILEELIFENEHNIAVDEWKPIHFSGLNNLVKIDLQTQLMDQLPNDTFAMLPKLKEVNLKMKHMNLYLFSGVEKFQLGGLDGDNFNTDALKNNSNLLYINIFGSEFNRLTSRQFEGFASLKELSFIGNNFTKIESSFLNYLVDLEQILFLENGIKKIPSEIFNENRKLKKIVIQSEQIDTLPNEIFSDLPDLSNVVILSCPIKSIPNDIFKDSDNIKSVSLAFTNLKTLPDGLFDNLPKLETLFLNNNKLNAVPSNLFNNLKSLTSLHLSSNRFKSISAANIKVLSNSLYVNFQLNKIKDIKIEDLGLFEQNTTVDLGFNRISRFSGIVYLRQHIERYNSTLLLRENPFNCSTCDAYHIVQERAPEYDDPDDFVTKPFSIDTFALKCAKPNKLNGKPVRKLNFDNSTCSLN